jgi:hypothetical protein
MSDQRCNLVNAVDALRFDAIADFADLAASYWLSIGEAAMRGEKLTCEVQGRPRDRLRSVGARRRIGVAAAAARL